MTAGRGKKGRGRGPVDLARERRIRAALGELADLVGSGEVDPERTRAYLAGRLEAAPMDDADDTPLSMRLPRAMVARLDALREKVGADPSLAAMLGGGKPSRSAVLRLVISRGLDALEAGTAPPRAPLTPIDILGELDALRAKVAAMISPAVDDFPGEA